MKNKDLINRILRKIQFKNYKLNTPFNIDGELYTHIVFYNEEAINSNYTAFLNSEVWEIPLEDLTNRELLKLNQHL